MIKKILILILIVSVACLVATCNNTSYSQVRYSAITGGSIIGNTSQTIAYGSDAETVTAVPYVGYEFVRWSDGNTNADRTDRNITTPISVTAKFDRITNSVSYSAGTGGSLFGNTSQIIAYGDSARTVTAVANEGYEFIRWSDGNTNIERMDRNITTSINVTAEFERITNSVNYSAGTGGIIVGEISQTVDFGNDAKIVMAVANEGYEFVRWSDGNTNAERTDYKITTSINVTAEFKWITNSVNYSAGTGGIIFGKVSQTVDLGNDAETVTAVANEGYEFVRWSDGNTNAERTDYNVTTSINVTAQFRWITYSVSYSAGTGGIIFGKVSQIIGYGNDANKVTAVADEGYEFVRWSDGNTNAERTDRNITSALNISAEFKIITKSYNYNYNEATANNMQTNITLQYFELQDATFIVPSRDGFIFNGWYLEWYCATQVADERGNITIDNEIFDSNSDSLYAKWTAVGEEKYKVLMVFVTELNATLKTTHGTSIDVRYKMTDIERRICERITVMLEQYLNAMLNGLVTFEVDEYFTKTTLGAENVSRGTTTVPGGTELLYDYKIFADDIPEVSGMLDDYRNVITTFGMNDYDYLLHVAAGSGGKKYASIPIESILIGLVTNDQPFELLFDLTLPGIVGCWESFVELYLHEFTHTVELSLSGEEGYEHVLDYHGTLRYYRNIDYRIPELDVIKLFFLNKANIDGSMAGIPLWFWKLYSY